MVTMPEMGVGTAEVRGAYGLLIGSGIVIAMIGPGGTELSGAVSTVTAGIAGALSSADFIRDKVDRRKSHL